MTMIEFIIECESRSILPDIALEVTELREALKDRDDPRVIRLLDTEF